MPISRGRENRQYSLVSCVTRLRAPGAGGNLSDIEEANGIIVVADDDKVLQTLYAEMLRAEGYQVLLAADGVEAIDLLTNESVDLGLIDVMMPRHNGFDVCRIIKSRQKTLFTPIVLVTVLSSSQDRINGIRAGADDFISKPIHSAELVARVKSLVKLRRLQNELAHCETGLFSLALSSEAKDPYTEGHCERVSRYAVALGEQLKLSSDDLSTLKRGSMVHDIGKITIPDHVLWKPSGLDEDERRQMEAHPIIGERFCAPLRSFKKSLPIIRWHHERLNGEGYPDGIRGEEIPLLVRIVQIVEVYDSLTTTRVYRSALTPNTAIATLRDEVLKGWWDGALTEIFADLIPGESSPICAQPKKAWEITPNVARKVS